MLKTASNVYLRHFGTIASVLYCTYIAPPSPDTKDIAGKLFLQDRYNNGPCVKSSQITDI